jgi:YD repeat-containing protein
MVYTYTDRSLIASVTEMDQFGQVAVITYEYDNRGRLIHEVRTGENAYEISYTYDHGGNRLSKFRAPSAITFRISDAIWRCKYKRLV